MLRAAAKNHAGVAVVVDPADYARVLDEIRRRGGVADATRFALAKKVFAHTAGYDGAIANYLSSLDAERRRGEYPDALSLQFRKLQDLRYGENPHQSAAFYRDDQPGGGQPRRLPAAAGQGALLQQHRRRRRRLGMREELRRAGLRHRQARQSLRRRARRDARSRPTTRPSRTDPDLRVRRHHRLQPRARRADRRGGRQAVRRSGDRAARRTRGEQKSSRRRRTCACSRCRSRTKSRRTTTSASAAACWCRAPIFSLWKENRLEGRDEETAHRSAVERPAVRLARGEVREVQRHRVLRATARRSASAPAR